MPSQHIQCSKAPTGGMNPATICFMDELLLREGRPGRQHNMLRRLHVAGIARRGATAASGRWFSAQSAMVEAAPAAGDLFNPSEEHRALRELCASFVSSEVEPQALEHNRNEAFNASLFRRAGELGLLGVTVDPDYGGAGMDASAACIVHEELSASDPAFCLSYLAHSQLFVNNLARNGNPEQMERFLPRACSGELIGAIAPVRVCVCASAWRAFVCAPVREWELPSGCCVRRRDACHRRDVPGHACTHMHTHIHAHASHL